jgi:hypothetical protein
MHLSSRFKVGFPLVLVSVVAKVSTLFSPFSQIKLRKSRYTCVQRVKTEAMAIASTIFGSKRMSIEQSEKDVSAKNYLLLTSYLLDRIFLVAKKSMTIHI